MQPLRIPPPFAIPADAARPGPEPGRSLGTGARLWLVRHAEVAEEWHGRAYGNLDIPLSPAGEEQTRALAATFAGVPLARVASSHLVRARTLGRAIAEVAGCELVVDERLREIARGTWQGLPSAEFRARWEADREAFLADPWRWKGHGGESDAEVDARAWPAFLEAVRAARGGGVVVAAHYNVIRVLMTRALGLRAHESFAVRVDPAKYLVLVDTPDGWRTAD